MDQTKQRRKRRLCRPIVLVLLLSVLCLQNRNWIVARAAGYTYPTGVPDFNAPITVENVMAIVDAYDPDGSYILHYSLSNGRDISQWFLDHEPNAEVLHTVVHEEFHSYTRTTGGRNRNTKNLYDNYYMGQDIDEIKVELRGYFKTEEWAKDLPEELRTFRYNTYVSSGASPSANQWGAYGLLHEFCAYFWGLNNQLNLYEYYKIAILNKEKEPGYDSPWQCFSNSFWNGRDAFREFRFYILGYLDFAEKNHPDIWKSTVENREFATVYCTIRDKYKAAMQRYKKYNEELKRLTSNKKSNSNTKVLLNEINSEPFQRQERLLEEASLLPVNRSGTSDDSTGQNDVSTVEQDPPISNLYDGETYTKNDLVIIKDDSGIKSVILNGKIMMKTRKSKKYSFRLSKFKRYLYKGENTIVMTDVYNNSRTVVFRFR